MVKYCLLSLLVLGLAIAVVNAQTNCQGVPNLKPISTDAPIFVNSTANGKLYLQNSTNPPLYVLHLYGTPYDFGVAHGTLLKYQINALFPEFYDYIYAQMQPYLNWLPEWLAEMIEKDGVAAALDATYELTKDYIPQHFIDEMKGIAAGSGLPYQQIVQIHMFPELIKAQCSMYGAWGPAISNTTGTLYQLRALDWDTNGPFQQFPAVIVYHPSQGDGQAFSILTWAGFVGAMTGYSSAPIGLCEKVFLAYNGTSSRSGMPWPFVLRDILQFDVDLDSAISRIANAARTCSIYVGLGDYSHQFRAIEYTHDYIQVYDDRNSPTWADHPSFEGIVYIDKHKQPSSDPCLPSLLSKYYGNINALNTIQYIAPEFETGDMHIAVYDYANSWMYVANASPVPPSGNVSQVIPAYYRPFIRLDMNSLFNEQL